LPNILKSNVWKRLVNAQADDYVFPVLTRQDADQPEPLADEKTSAAGTDADIAEEDRAESTKQKKEPDAAELARIEADQILEEARQAAEACMEQARQDAAAYQEQARQDVAAELEELRQQAQKEGYQEGFDQGMAEALQQGKEECERKAAGQIEAVSKFLEAAAREHNDLIDQSKEELKDLAIAIAEKVIRISLKSSSDVLLRMIEAATEKHKRCEWAHIYIADCDTKGMAYTLPELSAALGNISERVRIIPMMDDESGTCIIEMPDEIIDASLSTQMGNIRDILTTTGQDKGGE